LRDDWVTMKEASKRVDRSADTLWRWVRAGKVRTMRPLRVLWLYMPDVLTAEAQSQPGRPRKES
jgi:predicted site-specific integrase-resolvase